MKIVFLDSYTLTSTDVSLDGFSELGDFSAYPNSQSEEIIPRAAEADILIVNKVKLTKDIINSLPNLKFIQVAATGYNNVDVHAAAERGIPVCNVRNYSTQSVAQWVMACILHHANHVHSYFDSVKSGKWIGHRDFSYSIGTEFELQHKKLGIIGAGNIGKQLANLANSFGMNVQFLKYADANYGDYTAIDEFEFLGSVDYLSFHCPLNSGNQEWLNETRLAKLKPSIVLLNSARGGLIDEIALCSFLKYTPTASAYLDVLHVEPPSTQQNLMTLANCFISPHRAWASYEARIRLRDNMLTMIKFFILGGKNDSVNGV